jgi:2-polyprenyl-6-methoxyphenol hydroxylase-like FAD-dependent oxidoreductase
MSMDQLRVVIVGGGIGGLAAANALSQRGIDVRVYEQAERLAEVGAGVAVQPNGVRVLRRLGLGAAVESRGSRWTDSQYCRLDGTVVAPMLPSSHGPIDYFGMHRADLLDMLLTNLPGDVVRPGHRCIGFEQDDEHATVVFATGARVTADVVVGADGIHSTLQPHVAPAAEPIHSGSTAYRGVITTESVSWLPGTARLWMGEGKHFLAYPLRANQLLNLVGFVPTSARMKESWSSPGDPAELAREFAGWDSTVEAIIGQVTQTFRWGLYDREPRPTWTNGRLTLLGDAAHPMLLMRVRAPTRRLKTRSRWQPSSRAQTGSERRRRCSPTRTCGGSGPPRSSGGLVGPGPDWTRPIDRPSTATGSWPGNGARGLGSTTTTRRPRPSLLP